jgi:acyl-CoA reductase-like NAD-dependent aldehyde dehydrogenase
MKFPIFNPTTGEIQKELLASNPEEMRTQFLVAQKAQKDWERLSYGKRAAVIDRFASLLEENKEACARTLTMEMGKPFTQALNEVNATVTRVRWFLAHTENWIQSETMWSDNSISEEISYEPLGVIGNISAWNYPYFVGTNVFIPALLAGNAVMYKPSEYTTLTGIKITELLQDAGIPEGLWVTLVGGKEVGEALLDLPLAGVFFTGSHRVGLHVNQKASKRLTKVGLELGGKDPVYICEDVNVEKAVASVADGAFYNAGQSCCAVERIYVHAAIYNEFLEHMTHFVNKIQVGDPLAKDIYMGPLTRKEQLGYLQNQVEDALRKGARILVKQENIPATGWFYPPTVLVDVDHTMLIMQEESFGPIVGIQRVQDDREALDLMSETRYGLTAGMFTKSEERARKLLRTVNAGTVYWNCCDRVSPYLPWSGRKDSGLGSTVSRLGIQAFVQPKAWHMRNP